MKVDLTKVKLVDIEGELIKYEGDEKKGIYNTVAQLMYTKAKNLDLIDIAMRMNKGEVVERISH